jgi:Leucine-rich repeat (LRR) protein
MELLAKYRIQKMTFCSEEFTLATFHRMRNTFNFFTNLCLVGCKFDLLDHTVFDFCAHSLLDLSMSAISSKTNPKTSIKGLFKSLGNLRTLFLGWSSSRSDLDFDSEFVAGLEGLTSLSLSRLGFKSIKKDSFKSLVNLQTLNMSNILFESIEPGALDGLSSKLTKLDIDHFQLNSLKKNTFKSLGNLESLRLEGNEIAEIEPGAFDGLSKLTQLTLCDTKLSSLKMSCFKSLINLENLIFKSSGIIEIESGAFNGLSKLTELNLSRTN